MCINDITPDRLRAILDIVRAHNGRHDAAQAIADSLTALAMGPDPDPAIVGIIAALRRQAARTQPAPDIQAWLEAILDGL